jgi:penicillin-binding protein 2
MVSQGGFGGGTAAVSVRKIYEAIFGVRGGTVNPELALFKNDIPPMNLPRISPITKPKASILNPNAGKVGEKK